MTKMNNLDFTELYQTYGPMVLRRCRFMLKNEENALDAMHDVFLKVFEKQKKIKTFCASLFYVTATRVCLNRIRSEKKRLTLDFDSVSEFLVDEKTSSENEKIEASVLLENIFSKFDEKDSLITTLLFVDGHTLEETANLVDMSVSGVRKRVVRIKSYSKSLL